MHPIEQINRSQNCQPVNRYKRKIVRIGLPVYDMPNGHHASSRLLVVCGGGVGVFSSKWIFLGCWCAFKQGLLLEMISSSVDKIDTF